MMKITYTHLFSLLVYEHESGWAMGSLSANAVPLRQHLTGSQPLF